MHAVSEGRERIDVDKEKLEILPRIAQQRRGENQCEKTESRSQKSLKTIRALRGRFIICVSAEKRVTNLKKKRKKRHWKKCPPKGDDKHEKNHGIFLL